MQKKPELKLKSKSKSKSTPPIKHKHKLKPHPKAPPTTAPLSLKHQQFVERLLTGSTHLAAYQALYPKASVATAESMAWRLLQRPEVQAEIARLRQLAEDATILTLREKRQYLAAVMRGSADELPHGSNLVQAVTVTETRTTRRMPDKLRAIYLDCRLAGEIPPIPPRPASPPTEEAQAPKAATADLAADPAAIALLRTITHQSPSASIKPQPNLKPKAPTKVPPTPAPTTQSLPSKSRPAPPHAQTAVTPNPELRNLENVDSPSNQTVLTPNPEPPNSQTRHSSQNLHKTCAEKSLAGGLTDSQIFYLQHHQPSPPRAILAANWGQRG